MPRLTPKNFRRLLSLAARVERAAVQLDAAPMRDARTGTYTARGTISGPTLRKVWNATAPTTPNPARERFKQALVQTLRDSRNPVK